MNIIMDISSDDSCHSNDSLLSCKYLPEINIAPTATSKSKQTSQFSTDSDAMFDKIVKVSLVPMTKMPGNYNQSTVSSSGVSSGSSGISSGYELRKKRTGADGTGDNTKKKTTETLEKQTKKQRLAEEKAAKQATNELNKIYKPGECMKYMNVEMHPTLLGMWYCADVTREVGAAGARLVPVTDIFDISLVMWSRNVQSTFTSRNGQVDLTPSKERCDRALYISTADDIAEHVSARKLATHLSQIKLMAVCRLTLVILGVKEYFKPTSRKTLNSSRKLMTEIDMEMAITDALVSADCDTVIANTPNDLALLIVQFTKAIAEAPYKKAKHACDEQAEFYMRGDNKKCVSVDKNGHGLSRLWQQMIAVLPLSSLETSRALCAKYKSPLALYEVCQSSNSINELADIGVTRAAVPGSKARRLGPEFSKKLHTLFTAEDGNVLID